MAARLLLVPGALGGGLADRLAIGRAGQNRGDLDPGPAFQPLQRQPHMALALTGQQDLVLFAVMGQA